MAKDEGTPEFQKGKRQEVAEKSKCWHFEKVLWR
jgi:hypothetical protein